jgi:hypothetical protein
MGDFQVLTSIISRGCKSTLVKIIRRNERRDTHIYKVDKRVSYTIHSRQSLNGIRHGQIAWVTTYLQSLAKSMRRYMKSYFPQLDSSIILLSMAWSTLLGIFRSIIYTRSAGNRIYMADDLTVVRTSIPSRMRVMSTWL